jgi:hypothetical protein
VPEHVTVVHGGISEVLVVVANESQVIFALRYAAESFEHYGNGWYRDGSAVIHGITEVPESVAPVLLVDLSYFLEEERYPVAL